MLNPFVGIPTALALLACVLVVASCQTMSIEECQVADWQNVGRQDAEAGRTRDYFDQHLKSCERSSVTPDQTTWMTGYQEGLVEYCTPQNGLTEGQAGRTYDNICPPETAEGFQHAYKVGRRHYDAASWLRGIDTDIRVAHNAIATIDREIEATDDPEEKNKLINEKLRQSDKITNKHGERPRAQAALDVATRDLKEFLEQLAPVVE